MINISGYQKDLYHVFVNFKKAFDGVWHAALWATTRKYSISAHLNRITKHLYDNATSAVLFNSSTAGWFQTAARTRQGCLLSTICLNIYLERIMTGALEDYEGTVNIAGRTITKLRFADDVDDLAGEEE